jgi:hypothetical protein
MAARTAVVAGTATHVSNNVSRRQASRWERKEQEQAAQAPQADAAPPPPPAPAPAAGAGDLTTELERLANLKAQGILTDDEFAAAKAKLLGS